MTFRQLYNDEVDQAYTIIEKRFQFLKKKGIGQYPFPYPERSVYEQRQIEGLNYCLEEEGEILAIVTLEKNKTLYDWDAIVSEDFFWLSTLYTRVDKSGQGLGVKMLEAIKKYCSKNDMDTLLLDCYKDGNYLEDYYTQQGFFKVREKAFHYPGRVFNACLMMWRGE